MRLTHILALALAGVATTARAENADYARVISSVTLSFEPNGQTDRAVLVANANDGADLYVYFNVTPPQDDKIAKPALVKGSAAWSGAMWGTYPSLAVAAKGALQIKSENDGVGRNRWSQTLTVIYRNKEFIVAGVTRSARDTLDPKASGVCDLNLLTGKGLRNGKAVTTKTPAIKLADWSDEKLPAECQF